MHICTHIYMHICTHIYICIYITFVFANVALASAAAPATTPGGRWATCGCTSTLKAEVL